MKKGEKNVELSRIQVFARCRPLNGIEKTQDSKSVVEVFPKEKKVAVKDRNKEFTFDTVFQPHTKQIDVYKAVAEPLIKEVLKGFNCTILAYGQTGTGKTYTMEGERNNTQCSWEDDPGAGIIPRSMHQLFEELNKGENVEFSVRVSFLELYNEDLIDLLSSKDDKLRIYENSNKVQVNGLQEFVVNNKDDVYAILERGTARRQTAWTKLNASSSRSHTVFSVTVHIKENTTDGEDLVKTGKLNLVDLAGSECVGRSGCVNQRFREASNINMSLLTLGRVITALIENQPHIPYRESKLTRLLQDSLGGHTKTSFIATISPSQINLEETMSTLDYATKAKNITNKPIVNEKMTKRALIRELTEEIERLRKDLSAAQNGEGYFVDAENYQQMVMKIKKYVMLDEEVETVKQQNNEVLQDLKGTKEELVKEIKEHKETASKLTEVQELTDKLKEVLLKTAFDRDLLKQLLNAHHIKEKQLFEQNRELHSVVNESTGDVNKLHKKVERKQKVETTNEERCKQFKQVCHKEFAQLDDLVNESKLSQENNFEQLSKSIDGVASGFENYHQQITQSLTKVKYDVSNFLGDLSSVFTSEAKECEKRTKLLLKNLDSGKNSLERDQEMFCTEKVPAFNEKFSNMMAELNSLFLNMRDLFSQKVANFKNHTLVQSEERCKEIESITSSLQVIRQNQSSLIDSLEKELQTYSSEQSALDEDFLAKITQCAMEYSKESSLRKVLSNKRMRQNIEGTIPDIIATEKSSQKHSAIFKEETVTSLTDLDNMVAAVQTNEFTSQLNSVVSFYDSEVSEITAFVKNNQKNQELIFESIKDEAVANEVINQKSNESMKTKLKEIESFLCDNISSDMVKLDDHKNNTLKTVSGTKEIIEDSKQDLQKACQQTSREILQMDLHVEKFITEDLEEDIPTGITPQRKTYRYPKELINLSPDEEKLRVLKKLHSKNINEAVNQKLSLDSSFDDSDEFKSPFNQGFCESAPENMAESNHNTSSNNGDEYSDCETLSNASSMSDLSVNGMKNKENVRNFSKPSLNIPKFKKIKKRDESSIPTPTQRKPLLSKNPPISS